jgi:hypothetical protein
VYYYIVNALLKADEGGHTLSLCPFDTPHSFFALARMALCWM